MTTVTGIGPRRGSTLTTTTHITLRMKARHCPPLGERLAGLGVILFNFYCFSCLLSCFVFLFSREVGEWMGEGRYYHTKVLKMAGFMVVVDLMVMATFVTYALCGLVPLFCGTVGLLLVCYAGGVFILR